MKKDNNKRSFILMGFIFTVMLVLIESVVYSALFTSLDITGEAYARVESDVRVTDFYVIESNNAIANYEKFSRNSLMSSINGDGYVKYAVEVTNYGEDDVGIYSIDMSSSLFSYEISSYTLGDKLCDDSGKCNSFSKVIFYITVSGQGNFIINFDFRRVFDISYSYLDGDYPKTIVEGESLDIDLSSDLPDSVQVYVNGGSFSDYSFSNNVLSLNSVMGDVLIVGNYLFLVDESIYGSGGTECFIAGTKVYTEDGYKNIEDIKEGDFVYAFDLDKNQMMLKKVVRKFEGYSNETFEIIVNGQNIVTTPKHKFYVVDKGWVCACELEIGDELSDFNNDKLIITNIKQVNYNEPVKVYNLTVEDLHNYLISSDQLLVHNSGSTQ